MSTARQLAVANENRSIDESQQRAIAAVQAKPRTALEAMAARLQVSASTLQNTLKSTVFAACRTNEEFVALVVVSNIYGLNPMLKEIYAFPAKGQGIVPMVSVDGWIRIMNEHPAFDGIEFEYINDDKGKTEAIEAVIYRKDRSHPVKVIEYAEECKRNTDPWNKSPRRMLRHRALMQGARVAFGFSGIAIEGEEAEFVDGGVIQNEAPMQSLPSAQSLAEQLGDEIPSFDRETGEVRDSRGFTEIDEETARELDSQGEDEGEVEEQEAEVEERPMWLQAVDRARANIAAAKNIAGLKAVDTEWVKARAGVEGNDADLANEIDGLINARRKALNAEAGK